MCAGRRMRRREKAARGRLVLLAVALLLLAVGAASAESGSEGTSLGFRGGELTNNRFDSVNAS